ncbi:MAG: alpha/beta hydrolase [Candidatus Omnitrophica bacterium]|nr:alpha/beta hydrolase [Candidatus Omnitrophota bacterium]
MANYVLVHGGNMFVETWNKLTKVAPVQTPDGRMGGKIWDTMVVALKAQNHVVFAPTLNDEHTSNLTEHIEQICALITENNLKDIILAGHSYGGMVITGVAAKMADRIKRLVYVDAALPDPGQSLFDIIVSSGHDPMSFVGLEPAMPYVEKLQFDANVLKTLAKTYIRCKESDFACVTEIVKKKITAAGGWSYFELSTGHVPMATMPQELAQILLETG